MQEVAIGMYALYIFIYLNIPLQTKKLQLTNESNLPDKLLIIRVNLTVILTKIYTTVIVSLICITGNTVFLPMTRKLLF